MSNAQDLLSILSNAGSSRSSIRPASSTSGIVETSILSFKAGKMNATFKPNGKYLIEPDMRRGELHVVYVSGPRPASSTSSSSASSSSSSLKLEWRDRRTKTTVNSYWVATNNASDDDNNTDDDVASTFEKVDTGRDGDRVYLLERSGRRRDFFWMQDIDPSKDDEHRASVNAYIGDRNEAASAAGIVIADDVSSSSDAAAVIPSSSSSSSSSDYGADDGGASDLLRIMQGALSGTTSSADGARMVSVPGSATLPTAGAGQVDALGNILENLGLPGVGGARPSGERNAAATATTTTTTTTTSTTGGGLTLADLQGAMAGLATASPVLGSSSSSSSSSSPGFPVVRPTPTTTTGGGGGPPLSEFASSDVIDASGILDDPDCVSRLIALLPEGQRTVDALRENLRSPQVAQCLRRLTSALLGEEDDDDNNAGGGGGGGGGGGFNSIIANFQLNPEDGAVALAAGNPIEAFLNCLLRDVERKEGIREENVDEDDDDGGVGGGDDGDDEGGDGDGGGEGEKGNGDVNMDES